MDNTTTARGGIGALPNSQMSNFDWITDKNLLRDEGVYYGLSDSADEPKEKINAIRLYFQERIDFVKTTINSKEKELGRNEARSSDCERQIAELREKIQSQYTDQQLPAHDFWRYLTGLAAYIGMFVFNFWLIYEWLLLSGVKYPAFTAIAVYLFGAFSLFNRLSILYSSDQATLIKNETEREKWKIYLEEVAIPFVAAVYVVYKGLNAHPPAEGLIFFLLIFGIFIFAGKGLLNILVRLKQEYRVLAQNKILKKITKEKIGDLQAKIEELKTQIKDLAAEKANIELDLLEHAKSLSVIDQQKETHVSLFLSEYQLARSARKSMDSRQVARIISSRR